MKARFLITVSVDVDLEKLKEYGEYLLTVAPDEVRVNLAQAMTVTALSWRKFDISDQEYGTAVITQKPDACDIPF